MSGSGTRTTLINPDKADKASLFALRDPRPFKRCQTCLDFGMLEDSQGNEDACSECEGGIWRERIPWAWWLRRLELPFGLRIGFHGKRPYLYLSSPV